MTKYLVRLKPIDAYFFGSEHGFKDESFNRGEDYQTYLVKSQKLPQQTSILGMIRKEILYQTKDFTIKDIREYTKEDKEKMGKLIGKESFKVEKEEQSFGKIRNISPIMIYNSKNNEYYVKAPKDHKIYNDNEKNTIYTPFKLKEPKTEVNTCFGKLCPFEDGEYDPKKGICSDFICLQNKKIIPAEDIFIEVQKTGNSKENYDNAFYKQFFYKLKEGFEFAFYLDVDDDIELKDTLAELGKERSIFKVSFEKVSSTFEDLCKNIQSNEKIILLSDAYIPEDIGEYYAIKSEISFGNINTEPGKGYSLAKNRYGFWEAGSVIYVKNPENKEEIIKKIKNKHLNHIGYNIVV
jgi:CRISPR-associated protein Cmr3